MIVVADTSPLRYLIQVDAIHTLPIVYGEVRTTPEVIREMRNPPAPQEVRDWANHPPRWLRIESPREM